MKGVTTARKLSLNAVRNFSNNAGENKGAMSDLLSNLRNQNSSSDNLWSRLQREVGSGPTSDRPGNDNKRFDGKFGGKKPFNDQYQDRSNPKRNFQKPFNNATDGTDKPKPREGGFVQRGGRPNTGRFDSNKPRFSSDRSKNERRPRDNRRGSDFEFNLLKPILFDGENFSAIAKEGKQDIDFRDMDPLDAVLAKGFLDAAKSSNNEYITFLPDPNATRVQIPNPRSLKQLKHSLIPSISAKPNTQAHKVSSLGWTVLQNNLYFSDRQKREMLDNILSHAQKFEELTKSSGKVDDVLSPSFRPGRFGAKRSRFLQELRAKKEAKALKEQLSSKVDSSAAVEDEDSL